jgi:hypothetical protein
MCGLWPLIKKKLKEKLHAGDKQTVAALAKLFPAARYPGIKGNKHCVFCHQLFDARVPGKCAIIEHDTDSSYERDSKHSRGSDWSASCDRCGEDFSGTSTHYDEAPDDLVTGNCYEGSHCADVKTRLDLNWHDGDGGELVASGGFDDCEICREMLQGAGYLGEESE